jgi:centromere protein I
VPPATLVYNLFFAASPITAARVCSVVAKFKEGFQIAMDVANITYTPKHIPEFNGFLMDICNCLWRQRALSDEDANANGCLIYRPLVEDLASYITSLSMGGSLATLFSLSYSPTFSLFAISFLRDLEDAVEEEDGLDVRHAGPVTKATLRTLGNRGGINLSWDDYRRGVLDYLDNRGLNGIEHLLSITIGTLRQKKSTR